MLFVVFPISTEFSSSFRSQLREVAARRQRTQVLPRLGQSLPPSQFDTKALTPFFCRPLRRRPTQLTTARTRRGRREQDSPLRPTTLNDSLRENNEMNPTLTPVSSLLYKTHFKVKFDKAES